MQVDAIPPLPDNKGLSVGELKSILQHHLRENGSLRQLKAQLRTMVVTELLQNNGKNEKNEKVSKQKEKKEEKTENENKENMTLEVFESLRRAPHSDNNNTTMSGRIADSLIENHLRRSRRNLSLSIFTTEVEVLPLSEVGSPSCDERYLAQLLLPAPYNETENENRIQTKNEYKEIENRSFKSVLQRLVELQLKYTSAEGVAKIKEHTHHCGTQTESGTTNSDSALTSLECRLAAVDAKYALAFSQINRRSIIRFENGNNNNNNDDIAPFVATPSQVEKRIAQYKIDIYEQLKLEFDRKYEEFKNNEINRIREEAQEQYNVLARHKNEEFRELERTLIIKSEQEKKRLDYMRQDVEHQRLLLEKRQREVSESLLQHDDEISKCDERERKLKNKISELQLLVNKWEDVSAGRLVEIDAIRSRERSKVEEMRRMQAEFAAELRLKEESISRLRYRIRTLTHQPELDEEEEEEAEKGMDNNNNHKKKNKEMNSQLYNMLVRTEELQRNSLYQQQNIQAQQETVLEKMRYNNNNINVNNNNNVSVEKEEVKEVTTKEKKKTIKEAVEAPKEKPIKREEKSPISVTTPNTDNKNNNNENKKVETPVIEPPVVEEVASVSEKETKEENIPSEKEISEKESKSSPKQSSLTSSPTVKETETTTTENTNNNITKKSKTSSSSSSVKSGPSATSHKSSPSTTAKDSIPKEKTPSSHRSPASSSASSSTTHSSKKKKSVASGSSSHRSSAAPSSAASSQETPKKEEATKPNEDEEAENKKREDAVVALVQEEETTREEVQETEERERSSIAWTEKNQREVLIAQEKEKNNNSSSSSSVGGGGILGRLAAQNLATNNNNNVNDNVIYRDSDDGDSILFGDKSTDSSF